MEQLPLSIEQLTDLLQLANTELLEKFQELPFLENLNLSLENITELLELNRQNITISENLNVNLDEVITAINLQNNTLQSFNELMLILIGLIIGLFVIYFFIRVVFND